MRTPEEIQARLQETGPWDDIFGALRSDLIGALPFEQAKAMLKPDAKESDWKQEDPLVAMRNYLPFAFGKAIDHRGLSASRSVNHLEAWSWLVSDDCYRYVITLPRYPQYGMPHLWAAAQWCGLDPKALAGEDVEKAMRMAVGEPCREYCSDGCGR